MASVDRDRSNSSIEPSHERILTLSRAGTLVAATAIAIALGNGAGAEYRDAAYVLENFSAVMSAWMAALLIPMVPAGILGATSTRGLAGAVVLVGLIVLVASALLLGFAMAAGIGGEEGFPRESIGGGVVAISVIASVGAGIGYAIGCFVRRAGR